MAAEYHVIFGRSRPSLTDFVVNDKKANIHFNIYRQHGFSIVKVKYSSSTRYSNCYCFSRQVLLQSHLHK